MTRINEKHAKAREQKLEVTDINAMYELQNLDMVSVVGGHRSQNDDPTSIVNEEKKIFDPF